MTFEVLATKPARKYVVITGASSGIGKVCTRQLISKGYTVIASYRRAIPADLTEAPNLHWLYLAQDQAASVQQFVAEVAQICHGKLYGLVNNAGYGLYGAIEDIDRTEMEAQFATNVFGPMDLTQRLLPLIRANGVGRVVFLSSVVGYFATMMRGAYTASKFAIEGYADVLRAELQHSRATEIRVSLIEPGPVLTPFAAIGKEKVLEILSRSPQTHHRALYEAFANKGQSRGAAHPEDVSERILHALDAKRPKTRYRITLQARAAWLSRSLLPDRLLDVIVKKIKQ